MSLLHIDIGGAKWIALYINQLHHTSTQFSGGNGPKVQFSVSPDSDGNTDTHNLIMYGRQECGHSNATDFQMANGYSLCRSEDIGGIRLIGSTQISIQSGGWYYVRIEVIADKPSSTHTIPNGSFAAAIKGGGNDWQVFRFLGNLSKLGVFSHEADEYSNWSTLKHHFKIGIFIY